MREGLPLDNGQHLLLGAYEQTRNLLAVVHGGDGERGLVRRMPLVVAPADREAFALRARRWPARLGLAAALLGARGLSWSDRLNATAWFTRLRAGGFRVPAGSTVAQLCATGRPAIAAALWHPLCIAALNTPPERACAQVFVNVLRAALDGPSGASDFLLPATDLSALFPEAALRFVERQGGEVRVRSVARVTGWDGHEVKVESAGRSERFDGVVVAVGPHQIAGALVEHAAFDAVFASARALRYEPIATAWLGYERATALPAPIVRLDDAPGQWIVDRADVLERAAPLAPRPPLTQMLAVVISASGPHDSLAPAALAAACDAQLRRAWPALPPLAWSQTIVERRATYACTPGRPRPPPTPPVPGVVLAGDWLDETLPATLEAAVRSGVAAAFALAQ
jgi:squalene-associated FAD-dependent desaturase